MKTEHASISELSFDPRNARKHGKKNLDAIQASLARFGQQKPILVSKTGRVIAGNGTLEAAKALGWDTILVVRTELEGREAAAFAIADNQTAALAEWDVPTLSATLQDLADFDLDLATATGFSEADVAGLFSGEEEPAAEEPLPEPSAVAPRAKTGDVWVLGRHRVACGDSKSPDLLALAIAGREVELLLTDPPYCSGGFQEAGKQAGTWGNIANDNLSSRGFSALIAAVLGALTPKSAYVFTDWRMWSHLFDVVEAAGLAVRSMIVWDKGSPGVGGIWRPQHELVMFGSRTTSKRQKGVPGTPNVLQSGRTGNQLHYTEKPVELLEKILKGDQASGRSGLVVDTFAGSGSTLIACERSGRDCVAIEIEPRFVDVIIHRWEALTGETAVLEGSTDPIAEGVAEVADG